jgi:hypothetical protein
MQPPESFEVVGDRAYFRPTGVFSLDEAIALVDEAIVAAREHRARQILVNMLGTDGYPSPTIIERYLCVEDWAILAGGALQFALVVRPELIDRKRFGVMVAANRGLFADIFPTEAEAVAWLDRAAAGRRPGPSI